MNLDKDQPPQDGIAEFLRGTKAPRIREDRMELLAKVYSAALANEGVSDPVHLARRAVINFVELMGESGK